MALSFLMLFIIVCAVMLMLWAGVALIQDKKYFTSAPKDVQEAIQPRKERFCGAHALGWTLMAVSALVILSTVVWAVLDGADRWFSFSQYFLRFLIILEGYKVWDIVFLDWFLLTKSRFYQHYFPEVEGCESLKHFGFNRSQQGIKLLVYPLVALALSGLCTVIFA